MDTYKTAAASGFSYLTTLFTAKDCFENNFWFGGNAFHTCLDYLIYAKVLDNPGPGIVPAAYGIYKAAQTNPGWWRDDYAWWGIAFVLALDNRQTLGYGTVQYDPLFNAIATAAGDCWNYLQKNWRNTAYGSVSQDNAACPANITGGTYNQSPEDNDNPPMQGRNSVTNEGYWLLSLGLARLNPTVPWFASAANDEAAWFQKFLAFPPNRGCGTGILNANGLVLERPGGNQTASAWYWTGDQGLFSRAMFVSTVNRPLALTIVNATIQRLSDDKGILHENLGFMEYDNLRQFLADYATGKGIFMRGASIVNSGPAGGPFNDFIKRNATAVWCHKQGSQFTFNWNGASCREPTLLVVPGKSTALCNLIMQAAGQDALNAAMLIAPNEQIVCS